MKITSQIAKQFRDAHYGGNWTWSNLRDNLSGMTWQQATTQVHGFNTIAQLVYHMNYYVRAQTKVLEGGPLDAHDKLSFDHPPILGAGDWDAFLENVWKDADHYAALVEQFPDARVSETFVDEKYGTYYRNLTGLIEHMHYHLGQIALIRKILDE